MVRNGVLKNIVIHSKNVNIKLKYVYIAKNKCFDVFKKMNSKVQKWIFFNT